MKREVELGVNWRRANLLIEGEFVFTAASVEREDRSL